MAPGKAGQESALQPSDLVLSWQVKAGLGSPKGCPVPNLTEKCGGRRCEENLRATHANCCNTHRSRVVETGFHVFWPEEQPRALALRVGAYLLSNQEPTLDEPVQHFLTVAIGRLAGL